MGFNGGKMIEPKLGNPKETIDVLQKYQISFKKKYGQNFLIDTHVLDKIVRAADICKEDMVVEIGPGIGTLTQYLGKYARKVLAIEIDTDLIPILKETLEDYPNVTVRNQDVLEVDWSRLVEEENEGKPIKIVANLPYYITTPIIMGVFEQNVPLESMTVMVQKEVADRMKAGPGSKDYGALSLGVQYFSNPYLVANVPPNCFMPRPKVGSAVIHLKRHNASPFLVEDEPFLFKLIRASFQQRRKTLWNGLKYLESEGLSKEEIKQAIASLGKGESVRGEALTLEEFAKLSNQLFLVKKKGGQNGERSVV